MLKSRLKYLIDRFIGVIRNLQQYSIMQYYVQFFHDRKLVDSTQCVYAC